MTPSSAIAPSDGRALPLRVKGAIGRRALLAAAALSIVLGAALWVVSSAGRGASPSAAWAGSTVHGGLSHLPAGALAAVSGTLGASAGEYRVSASGGRLLAVSARERLRSAFDRSGVTVSSGAIHVGLHLRATGLGTTLHALDAVAPTAAANRVTYTHRAVSEWYVNGPLGVEQGFTLARAPSSPAGAPLELSLALSGNAHASLSGDGQRVTFSRTGARSLRYADLSASDAQGHKLHSWLELRGQTVQLRVDAAGARFPIAIDPLIQQDKKPAPSDETGEGRFGLSVALSADGGTALVGAPGDDEFAGAAWVFTRAGSAWTQQGPKLTVASSGDEGEAPCDNEGKECGFGRSVALSADGSTALVGAPGDNDHRGAAWVFTRSGSTWSQLGEELTGGAEEIGKGRFGRSVALSADGATALIGAPLARPAGAAWVFTRSGSSFVQQGAELTGDEQVAAYFGRSVALSGDGATALIAAPGDDASAGSAWVFARSGTEWTAQGPKLVGGSEESGEAHLGVSAALSEDGDTALLGARYDGEAAGAAWVFARTGSSWSQQGPKLTGAGAQPGSQFGYSAALSADGNTALIGAPHEETALGAAWMFTRSGTSWTQQADPFVGDDADGRSALGTSVALSADGGTALVGGPRASKRAGDVEAFLGAPNPPPPPPPVPTVTSIDPTSGPARGGTPVTIKGTGFLAGATVTIASAATSVTVVSSTEITAVTAAAPAGSAGVVVADANGTSTGGPSYTYVAAASSPAGQSNGGGSGESTGNGVPTATRGLSGVLGSNAAALPAPVLAVSGNVIPLSGVVRVKLPGSSKFTLLTSAEQIPFGSIVDARHGKVAVTTASVDGGTQTMVFYEGVFKLTQRRDGLVISTLFGGDYSVCPTARERRHLASASAVRGKHVVRKLWAEGHGSYSTKGNYATGAVLGTRWLTEDLCEGTLIRVVTDKVAVTNLITHKRRVVKAGRTYIARP